MKNLINILSKIIAEGSIQYTNREISEFFYPNYDAIQLSTFIAAA